MTTIWENNHLSPSFFASTFSVPYPFIFFSLRRDWVNTQFNDQWKDSEVDSNSNKDFFIGALIKN